ncbi:hypothetical protein ACRAWD_08155 [Caulobacter segnis]
MIGRKPLAVLAWGLVIFAATAAPMYLLLWAMRPDFAMLMQVGQPGPANDPQLIGRFMRLQSGMMLFQLLFWLWGTGVKAVICSAVRSGPCWSRRICASPICGWAREGWPTLLFLVEYVLAYIACFLVLALLGVVVVAIVAMGGGAQANLAAIWTAAAIGLAALVLFLWLALKLSMAAPHDLRRPAVQAVRILELHQGPSWQAAGDDRAPGGAPGSAPRCCSEG